MVLLDVLLLGINRRLINHRLRLILTLALHLLKQAADKLDIAERKRTGERDHRILRAVEFLDKLAELFSVNLLQSLRLSQNRPAERTAAITRLKQLFGRGILRRVLIHVDFFLNDAAFQIHIVVIEAGVQEHIRQNFHTGLQMAVQCPQIKARALLGGKCIDLSADGIHGHGDVLCRALLRPLKYHVFDEMGDTAPFLRFVTRTVHNPNSNCRRAYVWHPFVDHTYTVGQDYLFIHASLQLSVRGNFPLTNS